MVARVNPVIKVAREFLAARNDLLSLEKELSEEMNLSNPESPTERDQEILKIADKRFELNTELNPILKETHPLSRKKVLTSEESKRLDYLQNRKDEIFTTLKEMPDLGVTQKEWDRTNEEDKKQYLGRPGVSLELKVIRARILIAEKEEGLVKLQENLAPAFKNEIEEKIGKSVPISTQDVIDNEENLKDTRIKGSDSTKEISKIERSINRIMKDIEFIESGQAQAERDEVIRIRNLKGLNKGRPFEPLSIKLNDLKDKKSELEEEILEIEKTLSPYEKLGRKVSVARKDLRNHLKLIEKNKIDIENDSEHPLVEEYRRKELVLKNFSKQRNSLKRGSPKSDIFAGFEFSQKITPVQHDVASVKVEDENSVKKQMLEKARIKAKMKMKAKVLMAQKKEEMKKKEEEKNKGPQSDIDALRSIIG